MSWGGDQANKIKNWREQPTRTKKRKSGRWRLCIGSLLGGATPADADWAEFFISRRMVNTERTYGRRSDRQLKLDTKTLVYLRDHVTAEGCCNGP